MLDSQEHEDEKKIQKNRNLSIESLKTRIVYSNSKYGMPSCYILFKINKLISIFDKSPV